MEQVNNSDRGVVKANVFQFFEFVCRLGLGVLFIYSALAKISDPDDFARAVMRYEFLPDFTIGIFSMTMPMLELLAGLSMLFTKWLRESAFLVSGMLVMFIIALVQALVRGLEISCGCFGVPSVGGREEIVIALVRDVVLIVPAVWLMFRANGRIWPLKLLSKGWFVVCLCGFGLLLAAWLARDTWISGGFAPSLASEVGGAEKVEKADFQPKDDDEEETGISGSPGAFGISAVAIQPGERNADSTEIIAKTSRRSAAIGVSTGAIRPGEWNADFKGVIAKAERERRPMVVMRVSSGCGYCERLEECISGGIFRWWREDRAPLMAFVKAGTRISSYKTVRECDAFVKGIEKDLKVPYVCVYWPQNGVTNSVAFSGRRGMMGGRRDKLLVVELMSALDRALGVKTTDGHKTLESILALAAEAGRVSVRAEGGGTVKMTPEDGKLTDGEKVELVAHPDAGCVFLEWLRPDGSSVGLEPQLTVYDDMSIGCYTARFRSLSQCQPPQLVSPTEVSVRVKTREQFRHEILVDDSCRPVKFLIKNPVAGVSVDPFTGVVTGSFPQAMTNTIEISVIGSDPGKTEKTVRLTVEVSKKKNTLRRLKR